MRKKNQSRRRTRSNSHNLKIVLLLIVLAAIIVLALLSFGLKEKAKKGILKNLPEYDCGADGFCTSCIIEGNTCSCGPSTCTCGNLKVDKKECELFGPP